MPEPLGYTFDVTIDGKARTISMTADLFSTRLTRSLLTLKKKQVKDQLNELIGLRDSIPESTYQALCDELTAEVLSVCSSNSFQDAMSMIVDLDAIPHLIFSGSPDVNTIEEATRIAEECPDVVGFISEVAAVTKEVMEAVGKSLLHQAEEKTEGK